MHVGNIFTKRSVCIKLRFTALNETQSAKPERREKENENKLKKTFK